MSDLPPKTRSINAICLLLASAFLLFFSRPLKAQEAAIVDLVVANSQTDLLVFFSIEDAFSPDLIEGVQHGIPITFTFEVLLDLARKGWLDKSIANGSFEHTLTYDNLKKEYTIRQSELGEEIRVTDDFQKAQRLMCEANGIKVLPLKNLIPDRYYTISVKATLEKTTLPLNFHYIIPFSEFWDLKTDWTKVEFLY